MKSIFKLLARQILELAVKFGTKNICVKSFYPILDKMTSKFVCQIQNLSAASLQGCAKKTFGYVCMSQFLLASSFNIDDMNGEPEKTLHSIRRFLDLKNIGLGTIFKVIE